MPSERKKIIISPLNWGFGHAGRMIPVAQRLQQMGHEVIFGADTELIPMIRQELPGIELIEIPGIKMHYSRFMPQYIAVLLQVPAVILASVSEHIQLKRIVRHKHPDIVISDNRFGFFNRNVFCVYVTHMIRIPFPRPFRFLEFIGVFLHRKIINKYDACLVPDLMGPENLAGILSHVKKMPAKAIYAGLLSRFTALNTMPSERDSYICLILSGPEPQRTIMLKKVAAAAEKNKKKLIVLSATKIDTSQYKDFITFVTGQMPSVLKSCIEKAEIVISRSGYTSLMELVSLSKRAIIIPTPGQTEQEYLGEFNNGRRGFTCVRQNEIDKIDFQEMTYPENEATFNDESFSLIDKALNEILDKENKGAHH
ncbi:MAG TPA: glycosyltransferase [Bacteroidales bacterium]|nr:glycosyltransferase [Bacteroidales bacterium]HPT11886.1 glycosyltransferase [Bacteroidales bacterium]